MKINVRAQLINGFQIALDDGYSHSVIVDLPPDLGTGLGPTSLELCIMSHAGFYATFCALTAKKTHMKLKDLTVKVETIKDENAGTMTEENFDIHIKANAPEYRIKRLHELTLKNCPAGIIFEKASVKINYNVETSRE